jgi:hypothetical protein
MFFGDQKTAMVVKVLSRVAWFFFWIAFLPYLIFINDFETGDLFYNLSTLTGGLALVVLDFYYIRCFYSFLKSTHGLLHKGSEQTEMTIIGRYGILTNILSLGLFFSFIVDILLHNAEYHMFVHVQGLSIILSLFVMKFKVDRFQGKSQDQSRQNPNSQNRQLRIRKSLPN